METPKTKTIMEKRLDKAGPHIRTEQSYFLRQSNNHFVLLEVCEALTSQGFECFTARDEYEREHTHYVNAYRDGKRVQFGFSEVPYRWWVNDSSYEHGDCRDICGKHGYDYPFELDYIISRAVACSRKELEEYERKKEGNFYVKLGNFPT